MVSQTWQPSHCKQVEQDDHLHSITLEVSPLSAEGTAVCDSNRLLQQQMRPFKVPRGPLQSVPICSAIKAVKPERSNPQPQTEAVEVHARPFDIYVEFGLGARIMKLFGTPEARAISRASPLTSNYKAHVNSKAFVRRTTGQVEEMARARAAMHAREPA
jgi:hypothetical protein